MALLECVINLDCSSDRASAYVVVNTSKREYLEWDDDGPKRLGDGSFITSPIAYNLEFTNNINFEQECWLCRWDNTRETMLQALHCTGWRRYSITRYIQRKTVIYRSE